MINFFGYHIKKLELLISIIDIIVFISCFLLLLKLTINPEQIFLSHYICAVISGSILWSAFFAVGLYSLEEYHNLSYFFLKSLSAILISLLFLFPLWNSQVYLDFDKIFLLLSGIFFAVLIVISMRLAISKLPKSYFSINFLVITSRNKKAKTLEYIIKSKTYAVNARFLDIKILNRFPYLDLKVYCHNNGIKNVIIDNNINKNDLNKLYILPYYNVKVMSLNCFKKEYLGKEDIKEFYSHCNLVGNNLPFSSINSFLKRCFDISLAFVLFVLLLPIMLIVSVAIKIQDGGSVFYTQKRTGLNGKEFQIFKFRSMREDAEQNGIQWAQANDQRATSIGRFMRYTRIDELPQLINILKNDMSIVGPRPERPEFVTNLAENIQYYNERHRIKPGLTGWSQINMGYGDTIEHAKHKLEYDLYYLRHQNIILDFLILLRTLSVVLWPKDVH